MEAVGIILIVLIIIGAGTGISALINSYYTQKSIRDIYVLLDSLYKKDRNIK